MWIRNCPRIKASGCQMVALKTWKEGNKRSQAAKQQHEPGKLQGYTRQLLSLNAVHLLGRDLWINTRLSHSVLQVEDF